MRFAPHPLTLKQRGAEHLSCEWMNKPRSHFKCIFVLPVLVTTLCVLVIVFSGVWCLQNKDCHWFWLHHFSRVHSNNSFSKNNLFSHIIQTVENTSLQQLMFLQCQYGWCVIKVLLHNKSKPVMMMVWNIPWYVCFVFFCFEEWLHCCQCMSHLNAHLGMAIMCGMQLFWICWAQRELLWSSTSVLLPTGACSGRHFTLFPRGSSLLGDHNENFYFKKTNPSFINLNLRPLAYIVLYLWKRL